MNVYDLPGEHPSKMDRRYSFMSRYTLHMARQAHPYHAHLSDGDLLRHHLHLTAHEPTRQRAKDAIAEYEGATQ